MKSSRLTLALVLCAILAPGAIGLPGCNKDAAAKVNGQVISNKELNAQLDQLKKQYPQMFTGADAEGRLLDFKKRLLDNLINQALITQAAKEKGISVTDADVQKQIDQLKKVLEDATKLLKRNSADIGADVQSLQDDMRSVRGLITASKTYADQIQANVATIGAGAPGTLTMHGGAFSSSLLTIGYALVRHNLGIRPDTKPRAG